MSRLTSTGISRTTYGVRNLIFAVALAVTCGFVLAACGQGDINGFFGGSHIVWAECCPGVKGDENHFAEDGTWDPCFGNKYKPPYGPSDGCVDAGSPDAAPDASPSSNAQNHCPDGRCMTRPSSWDGPWLLWSGPPDQAPECPVLGSAGVAWEGYDDLAPSECAPCECSAATGTCTLSSVLTAHDVVCKDLGKPHKDIAFDAHQDWNGECDSTNPIKGSDGVASLSASAIQIQENNCKVASTVPRLRGALPAKWNTLARACHGNGWTTCETSAAQCIKEVRAPFSLCVNHEGDLDCPKFDYWPIRRVFYGGVDDRRECTECACGAPEGGICIASLSVYQATCTEPPLDKIQISSEGDSCFDMLPSGGPIGSKAETSPIYIAGKCAPAQSVPSGGTAEKINPVTFCCKP